MISEISPAREFPFESGGLVTVVIPTLNEERYIIQALSAIENNDFPSSQIQILLVDGGSTDGTMAAIDSYRMKSSMQINIIVKNGITVYQALKFALGITKTEYFLRVDARSFIPTGYISRCISHLGKKNVVGAGGVQEQFGTTGFGNAVAVATSHPFGVGNASFRLGGKSGHVDTVYLGAYRTVDLIRVGGYETQGRFLSEDSSINARLREAGGLLQLDAELRVRYPAKESVTTLARQYLIYGAAKATYFLSHGKLTSFRQVLPILFISALVLSGIASIFSQEARVSFVMLLFTYIVSSMLISGWLSYYNKNVGFVDLCIAFAVIHFSWPTGFICRIVFGQSMLSKLLDK